MKFLAKRYGIKKVHTSMEGCLEELKGWIDRPQQEHTLEAPLFDSEEELALHPEFVDMLAMNQTIMERWNRIVVPGDKVKVEGTFPNSKWIEYINGDILKSKEVDDY